MGYDSHIHRRRSVRLRGYDYSQAGMYFITVCCYEMALKFGAIGSRRRSAGEVEMELSEFGQIAYNEWVRLPDRFPNVSLDVFQIMPNHMHGIIILNSLTVGATLAVALGNNEKNLDDTGDVVRDRAGASPAPTVGAIVGAYKSLVANKCLEVFKSPTDGRKMHDNEMMGKLWQRGYHDHIIRDEQAYQNISQYILRNPEKWKEDKFFKE